MEPMESLSSFSCMHGEDRLSSLPEPLLHHILSFLDLKFVITKTTLLSKTWQYLWTTLPYLNFHFNHSYADYIRYFRNSEFNPRNQNFMTNVFLLRKSYTIHTFHLFSDCYENVDATYWLRHAVMRNVKNLVVIIYPHYYLSSVPPTVFTCKSLTSLTLGYYDADTLPDMIQLPLLTSLCLEHISLNNNFIDRLMSACPVLRTLVIECCDVDDHNDILSISSLSLEYLRIYMLKILDDDCSLDEQDTFEESYEQSSDGSFDESSDVSSEKSPGETIKEGGDNFKILISAPNLKYLVIDMFGTNCKEDGRRHHEITVSAPNLTTFKCRAISPGDYHFDNLSSLREANINVEHITTYSHANLFSKCLKPLCNVESLAIIFSFLQVLPKSPQVWQKSPIVFCNLKSLKLSTMIFRHNRAILYLLANSSNLEYLFIRNLPTKEISVAECFSTQCYGEEFSLQHLKNIEVLDVKGSVNELGLLQILLKNSANLERMTIVSCNKGAFGKDTRLKLFRDKLMASPQASSKVEVVIR